MHGLASISSRGVTQTAYLFWSRWASLLVRLTHGTVLLKLVLSRTKTLQDDVIQSRREQTQVQPYWYWVKECWNLGHVHNRLPARLVQHSRYRQLKETTTHLKKI